MGSSRALLVFSRAPKGYDDQFTDSYRVIVLDYLPADTTEAFAAAFTPGRVCADALAVADAESVDRFAWYGFSWVVSSACNSLSAQIA